MQLIDKCFAQRDAESMVVLTSQESRAGIQLVYRVAETANKWGIAVMVSRGNYAVLHKGVSRTSRSHSFASDDLKIREMKKEGGD